MVPAQTQRTSVDERKHCSAADGNLFTGEQAVKQKQLKERKQPNN